MNEEICECGHHKNFHSNEFIRGSKCVYGMRIGEKGIIEEGCKCEEFTPLTGLKSRGEK